MPTISQALMRNPSFPLIVPTAKWKTPQYILKGCENRVIPARNRASSVQIPFMGGTIVPSREIDHQIDQIKIEQLKRRRNSLPAHHTINERYSR